MIIKREKNFSKIVSDKISAKLDRDGILDYEVSDKISDDSISISSDLSNVEVFIPIDLEYSQYPIDDILRKVAPYLRSTTNLERDIYILRVQGKMTEDQYYKFIKGIIKSEEFITILEKDFI